MIQLHLWTVLLAHPFLLQTPVQVPAADLRSNPELEQVLQNPPHALILTPGTDICLSGAWEPTIAVDPNSPNIVAVAQGSTVNISFDSGTSFTQSLGVSVPAPNPSGPGWCLGGDPSLAFDSQGRLFMTYLGRVVSAGFTCSTCPAGSTGCGTGRDVFITGWQLNPVTGLFGPFVGPVNLTAQAGHAAPHVADKEWIAADSFPGTGPFTDRLYVTWADIDQEPWEIWSSFSSDSGNTWSQALRLSIASEGNRVWPPHVTVAPNHDVFIAYHAQSGFLDALPGLNVPDGVSGGVILQRSTNGGASFTKSASDPFPPGKADMSWNVQHLANGVIPGATYWLIGSTQPWVLADPDQAGRIYVVCNDDPDDNIDLGDAADVVIVRSDDSGASWSTPQRVDDAPSGTFTVLPTAAIDPVTGAIAVMWYDPRGSITGSGTDFLLNLRATFSADGGNNWFPSIVVNDTPFDPALSTSCRFCCAAGQCPAGSPITRRIGEYNGIAYGECAAHMTWAGNQTCGTDTVGTDIYYDNDPELGGDLTPPLIVCPANTQVGCNDPTDPSATGFATASDSCDLAPIVSYVDILHPGNCPPSTVLDTIERIWSAVDKAGNMNGCSQMISRVDFDAPVINVPGPLVIAGVTQGYILGTNPQVQAWVATAGAVDACTQTQFSYSLPNVLPADCAPGHTTQVLFQAADQCGNSSFALAPITVISAPGSGVSFCAGDGSITPCPCGNTGLAGHGCEIAQPTGGVCLTAQNFAPDGLGGGSVNLVGMNFPIGATPLVLAIRGSTSSGNPNGVVFGDGLLCLGNPIQRLAHASAANGSVQLSFNHSGGSGSFDYQLWFRNNPLAFCNPVAGFSTSNGVTLVW